ncbi:MAG: TonB-dependent receptor domain-containing protein [Phocaeicola coprocola]
MPYKNVSHGHYGVASMPFRNSCYDMNNLVHSLTAELNSNFGGKMSNQILGTYTKIADERGSDSSIFPMVDILKDGDMFMTAGYELYTYNNAVHNDIWTITDNFTMNLDKHVLTAGLSYEHQYVGNSFMACGLGYYRYNSLEDFRNGSAPTVYSLTYGYGGEDKPVAELSFGQLSAYLQDMWSITPYLKVTGGIRIDVPSYLNDLQENKVVSGMTFAGGAKINTSQWPSTKVMVSPRIGFNWDVLKDNTLRLRGGSGLFTGRIPFVFFTNMPTNSGMIQNTVTITDPTILVKLSGGVISKNEVIARLPEQFPQTPVEKSSWYSSRNRSRL